MKNELTRRELLRSTTVAVGALSALPRVPAAAEEPERSITCFYQFGRHALEALGPVLPNGPGHLHIFSHSHPGMLPRPETAKAVQARGSSFKYALAFDLHKYKGWTMAPDDQLKEWARKFREQALDPRGPADYFAFNEMPTTGAATPNMRAQAAKLVRYLHSVDGGPKLPGVFYFTERNLNPMNWQGEADDFWAALDETCDLVVGEHYHSYDFAMGKTVPQLTAHLFALPPWLKESGKAAQLSIASRKYAVLHSTYYGPQVTGWAGLLTDKHDPAAVEKYFEHVIAATRESQYGKRRIASGPLVAKEQDNARLLPVLARVLEKDAKRQG